MRKKMVLSFLYLLTLLLPSPSWAASFAIGSKSFSENVLLAEIFSEIVKQHDPETQIEHKTSMGGTAVLWKALVRGDIDIYPEFTGTILQEVLNSPSNSMSFEEIKEKLAPLGIGMSNGLGFENSYVLCMRRSLAQDLGIEKISDLRQHPELRLGFTHEYANRHEGWLALQNVYKLHPTQQVRTFEHELTYKALVSGEIDVKDCLSDDSEIPYYDLATLIDDQHICPDYFAVYVYRLDLLERWPTLATLLSQIEGRRVLDSFFIEKLA